VHLSNLVQIDEVLIKTLLLASQELRYDATNSSLLFMGQVIVEFFFAKYNVFLRKRWHLSGIKNTCKFHKKFVFLSFLLYFFLLNCDFLLFFLLLFFLLLFFLLPDIFALYFTENSFIYD